MQRTDVTNLRLVGGGGELPAGGRPSGETVLRLFARTHTPSPLPQRRAARQQRTAEKAVTAENRAASRLGPDDARAILAARVSESIEGGRAAVLPPTARRNLVAVGAALGLRPFDTSLVIAIVQDRARAGAPQPGADDGRLSMIPVANATPDVVPTGRRAMVTVLLAAGALALAMFAALVRWVTTRP